MLTHLCICAVQLYLFGANIASRAKYWSLVQNIDSRPAGGVLGDEGSSEGTMTQLEGNPKNPDNLLNLLYCPRLAGWLLGEHCISWMPAHGSTPRFWKESTEWLVGPYVHAREGLL